MFTGLIDCTGIVRRLEKKDMGSSITVTIESLSGAAIGDSVAVNGACLTLTSIAKDTHTFDVSPETMEKTAFGTMKTGATVNVEMPRKLSDRLHGHLVNGHIDCTAVVSTIEPSGKYRLFTFELPEKTPYLVEKGFIAVDGISVTPYNIKVRSFTIAVIPYTYEHTNLDTKRPGDAVNIEFDIIAKYIESMLNTRKGGTITETFLKERGFA